MGLAVQWLCGLLFDLKKKNCKGKIIVRVNTRYGMYLARRRIGAKCSSRVRGKESKLSYRQTELGAVRVEAVAFQQSCQMYKLDQEEG